MRPYSLETSILILLKYYYFLEVNILFWGWCWERSQEGYFYAWVVLSLTTCSRFILMFCWMRRSDDCRWLPPVKLSSIYWLELISLVNMEKIGLVSSDWCHQSDGFCHQHICHQYLLSLMINATQNKLKWFAKTRLRKNPTWPKAFLLGIVYQLNKISSLDDLI